MNTTRKRTCSWLWGALLIFGTASFAEDGGAAAAVSGDSAEDAAAGASAQPAAAEAEGFPPEQIEQLVAPVALYPDALLAQLLMASTYPLDIVQASRWVAGHPDLEGEALQQAVTQEAWDPSVQALAFFPDLLDRMNTNLDWTQDLGEAYLGQENEVMDAVQKLRREAHAAGNLETTEQQQVAVEGDTIIVQPAKPDVVYVPSYNPSTVYAQPAPTTTYYPAVYESSSNNAASFGTGVLVGGLLTAIIMWDHHDDWCCGVYYRGPGRWGSPGYWGRPGYWGGGWRRPVYIGGDVNINIDRRPDKWKHHPEHRGNIKYKNKRTDAKFSKDLKRPSIDRDAARGYDRVSKRDLKRPAAGDLKRPATRDNDRVSKGDLKRPAAGDLKRPATRDIKRPDSKKQTLPKTGDAARPVARDRKAPEKRDMNIKRPEQRQAKVQQAPQRRPAAGTVKQNKGSSTFKPAKGNVDRAASKRGAKSAKTMSRGGGGGGGGGKGRVGR